MKEAREEGDIHDVQPMIKPDPSAIFSNRKFRAVTYNACEFGDTGPFADVLVTIRPLSVT